MKTKLLGVSRLAIFINNRWVRKIDCFKREEHYAVMFLPVVLILLVGCLSPPRSVYDFDDGTTQGWKVTGVFDDQGNIYSPIFPLSHFEAAQYPNSFPNGDPLDDKKGCLLINGGQMGPWVTMSGFPATSEYWEVTAYYTGLNAWGSSTWQGLKAVKASVGDNYGAVPGHITVNIGVRATVAGQDEEITELDASGKPVYQPVNHQITGKWSHLTSTFNLPSNADVYQVWIRIRGDWKDYSLYEGSIMIDQVEPVK